MSISMKTKKEMDNHIADQYQSTSVSEVLLVCSICKEEFEHADEYHSHLTSHSIPSTAQSLSLKPFQCESCSYVCYNVSDLDAHKLYHMRLSAQFVISA